MRVVIFAPHFAEYALRYANSLAEFADVKIIVADDDLRNQTRGLPIAVSPELAVEVLPLNTNRGKYFHALAVARSIAQFRPDILHVQEVSHPICAFLAQSFRGRCKIAVTVHDPAPHSGNDSDIARHRIWCRDRVRMRADLVIVHGRYCRELFASLYGEASGRIVETRHGEILVPPDALKRRSDPRRALFFGRMESYKGLDTLTEAAEILDGRGTKLSLHVAGQGAELDHFSHRLNALPEAMIEARYLKPREVVCAMQAAGFVILPYHDATQSGVVAAAFANGRPVIATRVGGIPDVVEHGKNGLLVPPRDAVALADAMQSLLESPDRLSKLAAGAEHTARRDLNWDDIAREMHQEYACSLAPKAQSSRASPPKSARSLASRPSGRRRLDNGP